MSISDSVDSKTFEALSNIHITIVGAGSGGSFLAEQLVRTGLCNITIIDFDTVESKNISRTSYNLSHIGLPKVFALKNILKSINNNVRVLAIDKSFYDLGEHLESIFDSTDIVVAATDDPRVQQKINRCSFFKKKIAVFAGLYKGADGGEVAFTIPGYTPCFECMVPTSRMNGENGNHGDVDYGTGRIKGEIALSCDIHHLSTVALKIIIGLALFLNEDGNSKHAMTVIEAIKSKFHMILLSMVPNYFPNSFFQNVGGQLTFQSLWITFNKRNSCVVCNENLENENPFDYISEPSLDELRRR